MLNSKLFCLMTLEKTKLNPFRAKWPSMITTQRPEETIAVKIYSLISAIYCQIWGPNSISTYVQACGANCIFGELKLRILHMIQIRKQINTVSLINASTNQLIFQSSTNSPLLTHRPHQLTSKLHHFKYRPTQSSSRHQTTINQA